MRNRISELRGGTRPPDGLLRCAQEKTRPEAAFHQNQLHESGEDRAVEDFAVPVRQSAVLAAGFQGMEKINIILMMDRQ